mmetsp:Transcript_10033/g.18338  ORF Transcript_10033/g.18338 Transcript_10033/m.18338 type:complete len:222 (+) Transcript_10033:224-889(+)
MSTTLILLLSIFARDCLQWHTSKIWTALRSEGSRRTLHILRDWRGPVADVHSICILNDELRWAAGSHLSVHGWPGVSIWHSPRQPQSAFGLERVRHLLQKACSLCASVNLEEAQINAFRRLICPILWQLHAFVIIQHSQNRVCQILASTSSMQSQKQRCHAMLVVLESLIFATQTTIIENIDCDRTCEHFIYAELVQAALSNASIAKLLIQELNCRQPVHE